MLISAKLTPQPREIYKKGRIAFILRMQKYLFYVRNVVVRRQYHNIVAYFLKARIAEPEKQSLLGNGCVTHNNGVTIGSDVFCAIREGAM
jgi:hypothetical protein